MELRALRMYYKAAVVVPFYTMCFFVVMALVGGGLNSSVGEFVMTITVYSGITGLLAATIFLNRIKAIAFHFTYSLLSFFLVPCLFIAYALWTEVDWQGLKVSGGNVIYSSWLIVIFFIHILGLTISFMDFRRSIVKTLEEEREEQNELRTIYDDQIPYV
jgi:hypothetical protein